MYTFLTSKPFYWVFVHETLSKYVVLNDDELGQEGRWHLHAEGWELLWDSARSRKEVHKYMNDFYPDYSIFEAIKIPINFKTACKYVNDMHRHHVSPQGLKFSVALSNGIDIIGVAIVGRPVGRLRDNGKTLEVTRLCVNEAYRNLCSKLYSSAARIAKEMGYQSLVTYTLFEESGTSLKAAGFELIGESEGGSWNSKNRKRKDKHPLGKKKIWEIRFGEVEAY